MTSLSVVTPSFNRIRFLRAAMSSVLDQGYSRLDYVVVDGGSGDGSAELIASYADRLAWWVSEPDTGQYDALNKGFSHTTGEVMGWLNSDDCYTPWAFTAVTEIFGLFPEIEWLSTSFPLTWDERGQAIACQYRPGYSRAGFLRGEYLPLGRAYTTGFVQQESTFWRRSLWERCGGHLDTSYHVAADYDLWMRFSREAELYALDVPLAGFRMHHDQRTVNESDAYAKEAMACLHRHGGRPYNQLESLALRSVVSRLPRRARKWGVRSGLLDRRLACVWSGREGAWQIEER